MADDECDLHRNYVFGDRKSIELLNAFRSDLQGRGITLNDMNEQCDEFEKALDTLMSLPGDWHTGLNMVGSIFKTFYKPLLQPVQDLLQWKRINYKVSKCYYQASRLIKLTNAELHRFLLQNFVSERWSTYKEMLEDDVNSPPDIFCTLTQDYRDYLLELENCDDEEQDEFLKMCALFLHMSDDFLFFVGSYRANDAIGVI